MRRRLLAIRTLFVAGFCAALSGTAGAVARTDAAADDEALRRFSDRAAAYAAVHEGLEAALAPAPGQIPSGLYARQRLGEAIRGARAHARQGDVFSPDVAAAFRARLWHTLTPRDLATLVDPYGEGEAVQAAVNAWMPRTGTRELPPVLLAVLPRLPHPLEYRVMGRDLILVDAEVALIVDVLIDALAPSVFV